MSVTPKLGTVRIELAPKLLRNLPYIAAVVALVVVSAVVIFGKHEDFDGCSAKYRIDKIVHIGKYQIKAEEAKTSSQQQIGLGGRPCIGSNHAMLFAFSRPSHYAIWMKDMKFPIDIVWLDTNHKVVGLEKSVAPSTYPDRFANKDKLAQYVLELQAGRADSLGMNLGTKVDF